MNPDAIPDHAGRFRRFAALECRDRSPLYDHLASSISEDHSLLAIASHGRRGQAIPNLFLAAVHHLLRAVGSDALRSYYASLSAEALPPDGRTYPLFRDFCLRNEARIVELISSRLVKPMSPKGVRRFFWA